MTDRHIVFEELEFDDTVDQEHLRNCSECLRQWELFQFLGRQVRSAPQVEVPPFFAKRVTHLAQSAEAGFPFFVEWAARRLIPVFMVVLLLATSVVLFDFSQPETAEQEYSDLFLAEPALEEITWEDVVGSLDEGAEEGSLP